MKWIDLIKNGGSPMWAPSPSRRVHENQYEKRLN